ncbi:MAG: tRNA uridine-5-carboxymethylaminomethyl(34) synthesis enzyme MnmG [Thermomicrobiales bacterium]
MLSRSTKRITVINSFDVIVVGAGHAGCEAALAAARAGARTLVVTSNLDRVGFMPCNPSIGGPGKSHIVAEIDALGGEMARCADRAALQVRILNESKGPAVQAIRTQADKSLYALAMKEALERQPNLLLIQDEVLGLLLELRHGALEAVSGVSTRARGALEAAAVVITVGTFLRGLLIAGESKVGGARAGDRADTALATSLSAMEFKLRRLKTGTPPRIDARSVDYVLTETQLGSADPLWMSRDGRKGRLDLLTLAPKPDDARGAVAGAWRPQLPCFRISTNERTHDVIRENLHRAPMFNGGIDGIGPRYCPSIEDKVAKFGDKPSHPVFLEPEGWRSGELYVQGLSTSLPFDIQDAALRTIPALRDVAITRFGYAVEYDAVDPSEITSSLQSRRIAGLFLAGQVNGTSGYEEAAGQGVIAGWNAANLALNRPEIRLRRDEAYIGVMIDDLVNKPWDEPYRMLTSRAEYRLSLRPGTADDRLSARAAADGLVTPERLVEVRAEQGERGRWTMDLNELRLQPGGELAEAVASAVGSAITRPMSAADLVRRPEVLLAPLMAALVAEGRLDRPAPTPEMTSGVQDEIKYGAFVEREAREVQRHASLERRPIPTAETYLGVPGLRIEASQKLQVRRPRTFGEAGRLSGVTPSDIAALLIHATRLEAAAT